MKWESRRRLLARVLLTGIVLLGNRAAGVQAASTSDGFVYALNAGTAVITGYSGTAAAIVIPSVIAEGDQVYPVRSLAASSFYQKTLLTDVTLPDSITTINANAFQACTSLETLCLGQGLVSIGANAFGQTRLTVLAIPASVTSIADQAFAGCPSLTAIQVDPSNPVYQSTDGVLFSQARKTLLAYPLGRASPGYDVPDTVQTIGLAAFTDQTSLTWVGLPDGLTTIRDRAFDGCLNLAVCELPSRLANLGQAAFRDCRSLAQAAVPGTVAQISTEAFYGCKALTQVTLGEGIRTIGDWAFRACGNLTRIAIPASVTSIGKSAFYLCAALDQARLAGPAPSVGSLAFQATAASFRILYKAGQAGYASIWNGYNATAFYQVSYDGNSQSAGLIPAASDDCPAGGTVTVRANTSNLVRYGYRFSGWNTAADGSGTAFAAGDSLPATDHVTLYASWTAQPSISGPQAQLANGTTAESAASALRFIATIGGLDYRQVGFVLSRTNPEPRLEGAGCIPRVTTTVYAAIVAGDQTVSAASLGGRYIVALTLEQIPNQAFATPIYIRSFVRHPDGQVEYGEVRTWSVADCLQPVTPAP